MPTRPPSALSCPRLPRTVLERKYGDCKDRALLVREMARACGLEVGFALISTQREPTFGQAVKIGMFNHAICAWKDENGAWVFFDPTQRYLPFNSLSESLAGHPTFIIGDEEGTWAKIPERGTEPGLDIVIEADTDDLAKASAEIHMRGDFRAIAAGRMRNPLHSTRRTCSPTSSMPIFAKSLSMISIFCTAMKKKWSSPPARTWNCF